MSGDRGQYSGQGLDRMSPNDLDWLSERVLKNLPSYLRRYAPEMVDELRRVDPEFEREHCRHLDDRVYDPVLVAADKLEERLEVDDG